MSFRLLRRALCAGIAACAAVAAGASGAAGMASHEGWPRIGHHVGHPHNESGTMRGLEDVHNMLLGGDGDDRVFAGAMGDVI